jgi:hypothetical protein
MAAFSRGELEVRRDSERTAGGAADVERATKRERNEVAWRGAGVPAILEMFRPM